MCVCVCACILEFLNLCVWVSVYLKEREKLSICVCVFKVSVFVCVCMFFCEFKYIKLNKTKRYGGGVHKCQMTINLFSSLPLLSFSLCLWKRSLKIDRAWIEKHFIRNLESILPNFILRKTKIFPILLLNFVVL